MTTMRLLHFADLHLGIETYGSIDPTTGMSSRLGDFLAAFDTIVERAIGERVDAVLFAGDAFKNRDPSPTVQREFARRIGRLAHNDIPIVLLVGNHDLPNAATRATANEIYEVLQVPGVHVCRNIGVIRFNTRAGPLQIVALPWVTRSLFLSNETFRIMADSDLDRAMGHVISVAVGECVAMLDPAVPAVLVAHVSVQGATLGFEQSIMLGRDVAVGLDDLHAGAFDYIALGHIHRHQVLGTHPPAVYAGSPERIDFGEEREDKGFMAVEIELGADRRRTTSTFVPLETRPFRTLRITAEGDDPAAIVERELARLIPLVEGAIVRCFVTVDPGRERAVSAVEIRRRLADAGARHVAQVVVQSETVARTRWDVTQESGRDSATMLKRWVEMKDYDAALGERVLQRGLALIERRRQQVEGGSGSGG